MAEGGLVVDSTSNNNADSTDDNEDDDERFEDAVDTVDAGSLSLSDNMDLHTAIEDTVVAMDLFFNNQFAQSKARFQLWADKSMYHALGYSTVMYIQAAMTFQSADIDAAINILRQSLAIANRSRRRTGLSDALYRHKKSYDMTAVEVHAEVIYAECLMERAVLTFLHDENLVSFIKGSLKVKECYNCYKEGWNILKNRRWKDDVDEKIHFESGVRSGIGMFNVMISQLPSRVLKLLEFIGFSGNKEFGLHELEVGAGLEKGLRSPICSLVLIGYHTIVTFMFGTGDRNLEYAEALLMRGLARYPKGALFLFFHGRLLEVTGKIDMAVLKFEEAIAAQGEWKQFHHMCYWELMWCHCFIGDWLMAMKYAEKLFNESRWSPAIYAYLKASFLLMFDERTEELREHVTNLMRELPRLKQRIAGKSIPMEKFSIKKANHYFEDEYNLTLPAYELMYMWNGFLILSCRPDLLESCLKIIEAAINKLTQSKSKPKLYHDNLCLAMLLKGVCLMNMKQYSEAESCYRQVLSHDKDIRDDRYLLPAATYEIALIYMATNRYDDARSTLKHAKHNYKGYSAESRFHFRIHAASLRLQKLTRVSSSNSLSFDSSSDNYQVANETNTS